MEIRIWAGEAGGCAGERRVYDQKGYNWDDYHAVTISPAPGAPPITMYYAAWHWASVSRDLTQPSHYKSRQNQAETHRLCLSCSLNTTFFSGMASNSSLTSPQPLVRFISHFSFELWIVLLWYDSGYLVTKKEFLALLIKDGTKKLRWLKGIPWRDIQWVGNFYKIDFYID